MSDAEDIQWGKISERYCDEAEEDHCRILPGITGAENQTQRSWLKTNKKDEAMKIVPVDNLLKTKMKQRMFIQLRLTLFVIVPQSAVQLYSTV